MSLPETDSVLAIDPGSAKWGLAVVESNGNCRWREVVPAADAKNRVEAAVQTHLVGRILLGDLTGSKQAQDVLASLTLPILLVPEHRTTLLARSLYWRDHPPRGWRRFVPLGLLTPPEPLDAYAAEVLALRHFDLLPG